MERISIITPVLNGEKYIKKCIESIMELEIPFEHIIVDGGSADSTLDIVAKFDHLKLIHQVDSTGMYGAIQMGVEASTGEYLGYVNADDYIQKNGFEEMYRIIVSNGLDLVYSDSEFIYNESGLRTRISGRRFGKFFLQQGILPFVQTSSLYSKVACSRVNGFRYEKFRICGDLDLFQRIAYLPGARIKYVNCLSSSFLKYGDSLGDRNSELALRERGSLVQDRRSNIFVKVFYRLCKYLS